MPEKSGFFDTTADDPRAYPAREFAEYFSRFIGNGIFGGGTVLKVTASGADNKVSIATGFAWINGYLYSVFTDPLSKTIPLATTLDRIDRIVLRLNVSTPVRSIKLVVLQGTPNVSPVPPAITRSGDIYDLSLAQVRMIAGQSIVQPYNVTDERLDNTVCGIVTGLIQQADTTSIFNEFQSWMNQQKIAYAQEWQDFMDTIQDEGFATTDYVDTKTAAVQTNLDNHVKDYVRQPGYGTTAGTSTAYTLTLSPAPTALIAGLCVAIKAHAASGANPTLNVNSLGAKAIKKANGNAASLASGGVYTLRYDGTSFILQGEGGEYGTAGPAQVLVPYTIGTENGIVPGTMPNRGAVAQTITTQNGQYTIPEGYHPGTGKVTATFVNLVAGNVKKDVNIGGVVGTLEPGPTFTPGDIMQGIILASPSGFSQGVSSTYEQVPYVIQPKYTAVYRIRFSMKVGTTGNVYGRVYDRTTATYIGTERVTNSNSYVAFAEDILVQGGHEILIMFRTPANGGSVSDFSFSAAERPIFFTAYWP